MLHPSMSNYTQDLVDESICGIKNAVDCASNFCLTFVVSRDKYYHFSLFVFTV
jgi:hypothetical protein